MKIRELFLGVAIFSCTVLYAQEPGDYLKSCPERTAGVYHSYEIPVPAAQPRLKGYRPFYISHYGRHGSRWHIGDTRYAKPLELLRKAAGQGALSEQGRELLQKMEIIAADAYKRTGELTPRGVREHRGIAERMYRNYPEVFRARHGVHPHVESRSTLVIRCILSMAAFNERLKELEPRLEMTREASSRYLCYLNGSGGGEAQHRAVRAVSDSLQKAWLSPDRFLHAVFSSDNFLRSEVKEPCSVMYEFFMIASILQDVDYLGISLYKLFTPDELYDLWKCLNADCYLGMGPSVRFGDSRLKGIRPLLKNMVETAEEVIGNKRQVAATLRFGHDSNIIPLVALMGIQGVSERVEVDRIAEVWNVSQVSPMAANIQLVFYRNKKDDIRVRVLLNEHDAQLPVGGAPFYEWQELKRYFESKYR